MPVEKNPEDPPRGYTTQDVAATPPPPAPRNRHWRLKSVIALIVIIPLLVVAAWTWITLSFSYSKGYRAGYVQKMSKRGWLCPTWEGELSQVIPGQAQIVAPSNSALSLNTFDFTVRDDSVAHQIESTEGKHVRLTYAQHRGVPLSCFGDTEYFVTGVQVID